jgi:hypothetical protein
MTLAGICRQLRAAQPEAHAVAASIDVERKLLALAGKPRKGAGRAKS